jgi:GT2 family glycosyltransferase
VILANNRSTDDSLKIASDYQARLPNLRLIEASARQGPAYALNCGAAQAHGELLLFCDADDEIAPGWVTAMGNALAEAHLVACRFDTQKLNAPWMYRSRSNSQSAGLGQYRYPPYLPHAGGGGLGVRRAVFEELNGFDESLLYLQDTDFCWRAQLKGYKLQFVPDAVLYVRFRESLLGLYRQARNYGEYNVALYQRYRPLGMPPLPKSAGLRAWVRILYQLIWLRNRVDVARWLWDFGWRVGRIRGSLRYRVWAL